MELKNKTQMLITETGKGFIRKGEDIFSEMINPAFGGSFQTPENM